MKFTVGILFIVAVWATNLVGQGTVLWDESVNGPLSNDGGHPTSLGSLTLGTNSISGATEYVSFGNSGALYGDYFTFTVPQTAQISSLTLSVDKPVLVWIGDPSFSASLSYVFNPANGDLLPQLALQNISSGTYGMYIKMNEFSSSATATYRFEYFTQTVPEPSTSCLLVGAGVVGFLRWKKCRSTTLAWSARRSGPGANEPLQQRGITLQPLVKRTNIGILFAVCSVTASLTGEALGQGTILWDESVNGPFSHFSSSPTSVGSFHLGTNTIIGAVEIEPNGSIWISYEDFFIANIPTNLFVSAIYFQVDKPNVQTWIGDTSFGNQLGFAASSTSGELLAQWGVGAIGPGNYGMYLANHDAEPIATVANYRLDFFTQSVPEPSAISLLLLGAGVVGYHRWKKFQPRAASRFRQVRPNDSRSGDR